MSAPSVAVIVGSGRGIGLELSRLYLAQSKLNLVCLSRDAAAARDAILDSGRPAPLQVHSNGSSKSSSEVASKLDGSRLTTIEADVKSEDSLRKASEQVREQFGKDSLRFLINVAGVLKVEKNISQVNYEELLEQFQINAFAPLFAMKHFSPLIPRSFPSGEEDLSQGLMPDGTCVLASLSARVGSISENKRGGWYGYRSSKAAQNQITRVLSHELVLRKAPAVCVGLHPGTVRTDLSEPFTGGPGGKSGGEKEDFETRKARGEFEANESANLLAGVISNLKRDDGGKVWDWQGKEIAP